MTYLIQGKSPRGALSRRTATEEAALRQAADWVAAGMTVGIMDTVTGQMLLPGDLEYRIDARRQAES